MQSCFSRTMFYILIVFLFQYRAESFNVDTLSYIRHSLEPNNSMFGFSVALHREADKSWVIVGAPKADTSRIQRGVIEGGAVYRCDITDDDRCQLIPFDVRGNKYNDFGDQMDTKSKQWFGATVVSAGINGPLIACAPRYVFHTTQPSRVPKNEPVGTCFMAKKNFEIFREYSPCRTSQGGYHRQGSCQAGFSAAVGKDGERLFIGAPGSWYWQGQAFSINSDSRFPYIWPRFTQLAQGQIYSMDLTSRSHKVYETRESTLIEDDSYLGYSSATGDFNGDNQEGVAVGMPRGGELRGKVVIFHWNMTNQENITGEQIGAYFGYALCVTDVDGDSLDDLIVGAPMYTKNNNEGKYENGRVYIYYQNVTKKFSRYVTLDGQRSRARFGLSLTSLGDLNKDKYNDFAVGAPYDGLDGNGAVYIYHGSSTGVVSKFSQVIYAENIVGMPVPRTFGFSISGGIDLDVNMYPDLVVGAYESSTALVFKARPVIIITAATHFEGDNKFISLDDKKCEVSYSWGVIRVPCIHFNSCIEYTGINVPYTIDLKVSWILDSKKQKNPRMFFFIDKDRSTKNSTITLDKGKNNCATELVYIGDNIKDKLTPLEIEMRYELASNENSVGLAERQKNADLYPVIDPTRGNIQKDYLNIQKNCGNDNICIPNLGLEIQSVEKFLLGSNNLLNITVIVSNSGEDAFEANFYMRISQGVDFKKIVKHTNTSQISATAPSALNNYTLKCELGNPLSANQSVKFTIVMTPSTKFFGVASSYDFYMEANSTNPEAKGNEYDNIINKSILVWVNTDLTIEGKSEPLNLYYNNAKKYVSLQDAKHENDIGEEFKHTYDIYNNGLSTIEETEIYLIIPQKTQLGEEIIYLTYKNTNENVVCDPIEVNKYNLTLQSKLSGITHSSTSVTYSNSSSILTSSSNTFSESNSAHISNIKSETMKEESTNINYHINHSINENNNAFKKESQYLSNSSYQTSRSPNLYENNWNRTVISVPKKTTFGYEPNGSSIIDSNQYINRNGNSFPFIEEKLDQRSNNNLYTSVRNDQHISEPNNSIVYETNPNHINYMHRNYNTTKFNEMDVSAHDSFNQQMNSLHRESRRKFEDIPFEENISQDLQNGNEQKKLYIDNLNPGGNVLLNRKSVYSSRFDTNNNNVRNITNMNHNGEKFSHRQYFTYDNKDYTTVNPHSQLIRQRISGFNPQTTNNNEQITHNGGSGQSSYSTPPYSSTNIKTEKYGYNTDIENPEIYVNVQTRNLNMPHSKRVRKSTPDLNSRDNMLKKALNCDPIQCTIIKCSVGALEQGMGAWIEIRARVVAKTLQNMAAQNSLNMSTMLIARITKLPFIGSTKDTSIKNHEISFMITPDLNKEQIVPLWIVVLSACAGTIILLLLIYLLHKCGFFERSRPLSDTSERQPLNKNGNYHGDEHL